MMLVIATFSGMILPLVFVLLGIGLTWMALLILFKTLKNSKGGSSPMINSAAAFFAREKQMSVCYLSPDLEKVEGQILSQLHHSGDDLATVNQRFGVLIGVVGNGEQLPGYYQHLVSKRVLFEYHRKYGDVKQRYMNSSKLPVTECLSPIAPELKPAFDQFCLVHSI